MAALISAPAARNAGGPGQLHVHKIPVLRDEDAPFLGQSRESDREMRASRILGAISATISLHLTGKVLPADQRLAGEFHLSLSDRHQVGARPLQFAGRLQLQAGTGNRASGDRRRAASKR
ncbi:hypothetical protein ATY30_09695 [Sinorhizobium americanum]|nr:hypothetical protein CO664_06005 [Sinorhizobium sp. NG07B]POH31714.1 hypothetical protein ATY30_09695 [Sinorhizobium americanum]